VKGMYVKKFDVVSHLDEPEFKGEIIAFPNPTNSIFHLQTYEKIGKVQLFDSSGRQILSANSVDVDISNFPTGIYMLVATFRNGEKKSQLIFKL
jgi:hypothetical protein